MKIYLIYDKTLSQFIKQRCGEGRKYLVYGDIRSARTMANYIKRSIGYLSNDIVVVEYETNIEHMKEV